jgi:hypothetical protein
MATQFRDLLGTDHLGTTAISLLSNSLAPSTYANYDSALRPYASPSALKTDAPPNMPLPLPWFATPPGSAYVAPSQLALCNLTFLQSASTSETTSYPPSPLATF